MGAFDVSTVACCHWEQRVYKQEKCKLSQNSVLGQQCDLAKSWTGSSCPCLHLHMIKTASSCAAPSSIAHPFALDAITPAYDYGPSSQFCLCSCMLLPSLVCPGPHHASLLTALHPREHHIIPNIHHHHRCGLGTPPVPVYCCHSLAQWPDPTKTSRPPYKSPRPT